MATQIQSQSRPAHVLIVEDNRMDVYFLKEALRHCRVTMNFDEVDDGSKALHYLRHGAGFTDSPVPDLILLDLALPRENGWVVLEEIKRDPVLSQIPVVILTGFEDETGAKQAREGKAELYIIKPLGPSNFQLLVKSVERLLEKKFQNEK